MYYNLLKIACAPTGCCMYIAGGSGAAGALAQHLMHTDLYFKHRQSIHIYCLRSKSFDAFDAINTQTHTMFIAELPKKN